MPRIGVAYARRLFNQMPVPEVDDIEKLPPAVAVAQRRGATSTLSSVADETLPVLRDKLIIKRQIWQLVKQIQMRL